MVDITSRADSDMKPRRLVPRALGNIKSLKAEGAVPLSEVAEILDEKIDLLTDIGSGEFRRVVEGQDIRAVEGLVVAQFSERDRHHRSAGNSEVVAGVGGGQGCRGSSQGIAG